MSKTENKSENLLYEWDGADNARNDAGKAFAQSAASLEKAKQASSRASNSYKIAANFAKTAVAVVKFLNVKQQELKAVKAAADAKNAAGPNPIDTTQKMATVAAATKATEAARVEVEALNGQTAAIIKVAKADAAAAKAGGATEADAAAAVAVNQLVQATAAVATAAAAATAAVDAVDTAGAPALLLIPGPPQTVSPSQNFYIPHTKLLKILHEQYITLQEVPEWQIVFNKIPGSKQYSRVLSELYKRFSNLQLEEVPFVSSNWNTRILAVDMAAVWIASMAYISQMMVLKITGSDVSSFEDRLQFFTKKLKLSSDQTSEDAFRKFKEIFQPVIELIPQKEQTRTETDPFPPLKKILEESGTGLKFT
eukprot:2706417-Rhodomonas_salina.1